MGKPHEVLEALLNEFRDSRAKNQHKVRRYSWLENDSIQYLMIKRFVFKHYKDNTIDRQFIEKALNDQNLSFAEDVIGFVNEELDYMEKRETWLQEKKTENKEEL